MNHSSGRCHYFGRALAGRIRLVPDLEAALIDPHRVPYRLELGLALDRASEIELHIEGDEIDAGERLVVADRHDVVQPVHANPLPTCSTRVIGDVLARASVEDLIEWRRAVLTDVPRLGREDDERVTIGRENHMGISMHDLESRT